MQRGRIHASKEMVLNDETLNTLSRAHGIRSEAELARLIGVNSATLYRVRQGLTAPSNAFIAGIKLAFPAASLDSLFTARKRDAA